jgi:hypothetical protein
LLAGYKIGFRVHNELLGNFEWQELLWCIVITLASGKNAINRNPLFSPRAMFLFTIEYITSECPLLECYQSNV